MKSHLTVAVAILITALGFLPGIAHSTELPSAVPLEKYQAMIDKSPFAVATPVAPAADTAPATAPFAQDLYITGIAKLGKDDFVTISSKDQSQRFSLMMGDKGPDGISLVAVIDDDKAPGKRRVKLQKGTESGDILFDEAAMHASPQPQVAPPGRILPGQRPGVFPPRQPRVPPSRIPPPPVGINGRRPLVQPGQINQPGVPPLARRRGAPIPNGPR